MAFRCFTLLALSALRCGDGLRAQFANGDGPRLNLQSWLQQIAVDGQIHASAADVRRGVEDMKGQIRQDPTGTESTLSDLLVQLSGQVDAFLSQVKNAHDVRQFDVDEWLSILSSSTQEALNLKVNANRADTQWVQSVDHERALLEYYEKVSAELGKKEYDAQYACVGVRQDPKWMSRNYAKYKACTDAEPNLKEAQETEVKAKAEFEQQKSRREHLASKRLVAMCSFGQKLHTKCEAKQDYEALMSFENQNPQAIEDRKNEWIELSMLKCMLNKMIKKEELTEAACAVCDKAGVSNNPTNAVLNMKIKQFLQQFSHNAFTCNEKYITFNGTSWVVPSGAETNSFQYRREPYYLHQLDTTPGNKVFDFCRESHMRETCEGHVCAGGGAAKDAKKHCALDTGCHDVECCDTVVPDRGELDKPDVVIPCGGYSMGAPCAFPFRDSKGQFHTECITDNDPMHQGRPWCSVHPTYPVLFGFCDGKCGAAPPPPAWR